MTEAVLRAAGLRTGLYTSPHLVRFTERIRIDGREADGDRLAALDRRVVATEVPLTYFEIATVLAFLAMAEARRRDRGAGDRARRASRRGHDLRAVRDGDHLDRPRSHRVPRRHAGGDRAGEGRHPQAGCSVLRRAAAARGRRRDRPRGGRRRRAAVPLRPRLRPAAVPDRAFRRASEGERRAGGAARARGRPRTWGGRSPIGRWRAGWTAFAGRGAASGWATTCCSTARTTSTARGPWPRRCPRWRRDAAWCWWCRSSATRTRTRCWRPWRRSPPPSWPRAPTIRARWRPRGWRRRARRHVADTVACDDPAAALDEARRRAGPGGLVVVCGSMFLVGMLRARVLGEPVDPLPTSDPVQRMSISST